MVHRKRGKWTAGIDLGELADGGSANPKKPTLYEALSRNAASLVREK